MGNAAAAKKIMMLGVRENPRFDFKQPTIVHSCRALFGDGALAPDLRCAIAHRGISRFRVRYFASPRNDRPRLPVLAAVIARVLLETFAHKTEGAGNAGCPMH